jgi:hypothetical protein
MSKEVTTTEASVSKMYRVVITNVLGYKLSVLQKRVCFFFWKDVIEMEPNEDAGSFYDRMKDIVGNVTIKVIEKIIP